MFPNKGSLAPYSRFINPFCTGETAVPRKKNFDDQVEKGVSKLLETALAGEHTEAQSAGVELRLKVLNTAINFMKVKHKIDEGAAGSAFGGDPDDPTGDP